MPQLSGGGVQGVDCQPWGAGQVLLLLLLGWGGGSWGGLAMEYGPSGPFGPKLKVPMGPNLSGTYLGLLGQFSSFGSHMEATQIGTDLVFHPQASKSCHSTFGLFLPSLLTWYVDSLVNSIMQQNLLSRQASSLNEFSIPNHLVQVNQCIQIKTDISGITYHVI